MINHVRKFLLILALLIIGISGYNFIAKFNKVEKIKEIELMDKEVDVKIQNFKVVHEVSGSKEWELEAESAVINNEQDIVNLQTVEFRLHPSKGRKFNVWADTGVYQSLSKEINLAGNVRVIGESRLFRERLDSTGPATPVSVQADGEKKDKVARSGAPAKDRE